jgi:gliding motility-associated-like protein
LTSNFSGSAAFNNEVYLPGTASTVNSLTHYNTLFSKLDKESFIDYMILNSYAMNSNLWSNNIAFAKGGQVGKPGDKWHYYLWNMPSIFNFTALSLGGTTPNVNENVSPCYLHATNTATTNFAGNGHGNILRNLMNSQGVTNPTTGKYMFQRDYKTRYQDLLNGPLKCENILKHYDYVKELFLKEMKYHEDPAVIPLPGKFSTVMDGWDTLTTSYRKGILKRCTVMGDEGLGGPAGGKFGGCYAMGSLFPLTVDVFPVGAGTVKLNSIDIQSFVWTGEYYGATPLSLKATPTSSNYTFHHWEFKKHIPLNNAPLSLDSVGINYSQADDVIAVFTDRASDISMPTAFSPNGDNNNDVFRPMGSALNARDFDMSIWNRWGQEVYRSTDPNMGWDGTMRGQQAQTGVYAYVITYKNMFNESKILKGNLTLLR